MRLGIDFGTSYSSAALFLDNRLRAIKDPINLGYSFPSSVFLTPKGEMLVGHAAENKRQLKPDCYQREFKRELGSDFPYFLGSTKKMPEDLVTEVIKKLKIEADKVAQGLGELPLTQVILTIPATYEPKKRQLMRETCQLAGFEKIKLLEEPIAAGIYYSHFAKVPEDAIILVYDLGGGTFDATLLQKRSSDYQLLGMPMGLPDCGGADFDRLIFQELLQQCSPSLQQKLKSPEFKDFRNRIFPECFKLKHQLSEASEGEIWIPTGEAESFSLTRERFNEMISGLVCETINCCDLLLTKTELSWSQIDRVLLVGGSCRIPYVREMVAQKWGKTPIQVDEPELAVCYGAAIYGASLELESPEYYLERGLEQIQTGDYKSAIAEFDQAIRLDSNYAPAYCHRGLAHAQLNETQSAFEDYDLAIRLERNYGKAYLHRGNLRCQSNDLKGAIEDYDRALFVNPELTEAAEKKELVFQLISVAASKPQAAVTNSTVSWDEVENLATQNLIQLALEGKEIAYPQKAPPSSSTKPETSIPQSIEEQLNSIIFDVDYNKLEQFLAKGKWQQADRETNAIILNIAGRQKENYLEDEDIENLSCLHLSTIDQLWVKYSKGRFGFSVQKLIWQEVQPNYETFCNRVGWHRTSTWFFGGFLDTENLNFSLKAPVGHLPFPSAVSSNSDSLLVGGKPNWEKTFFARIETCGI